MELEELTRKIAIEARQIQAELQQLKDNSSSNHSVESTLGRIEDRLIKVHSDTEKLVERVPENLKPLLLEVKAAVLDRIDSLKEETTESTGSTESFESGQHRKDWRSELLKKLTPRERSLFTACFGSGLITYKELAARLNITPVSAKNIVNRLFQNADKRRLFSKTRIRGVAKIGLTEVVEQRVLRSEKDSKKGKKPAFIFEDQV